MMPQILSHAIRASLHRHTVIPGYGARRLAGAVRRPPSVVLAALPPGLTGRALGQRRGHSMALTDRASITTARRSLSCSVQPGGAKILAQA